MEYINKQQILEKAKKHQNNPFGASLIIAEIEKADGVDVKQGYWKRETNKVCYWYVCSECRDEIPRNKYGGWSFPEYCPNCGARMDGDVNDL